MLITARHRKLHGQAVYAPPSCTVTPASGWLTASWAFPTQNGSTPASYSLAWTPQGGSPTTVSLSGSQVRYDIESNSGTAVAYGTPVSVTVTATYPDLSTLSATGSATMVALTKPRISTTGPRLTGLSVNTSTVSSGFNTTPDGSGIVHYTGQHFTQQFQLLGTNGGPNTINGYVFTDCIFDAGLSVSGAHRGYVTLDHCFATAFDPSCPTGTVTRCRFDSTGILDAQGRNASIPFYLARFSDASTVGTTLSSTPWTFTDTIFVTPYPNLAVDGSDPHYEAVHIKGAKDVTFSRCLFDCGYRYKPDGVTLNPDVTACFSIETGYGGNDNIEVSDSWMYGVNQNGFMINMTCTNFRYLRNRIGHIRAPGDLSQEGNGYAAPGVNIEDLGLAQISTYTFSGNVWDIDGTSPAAGFLGRQSSEGGNSTLSWA